MPSVKGKKPGKKNAKRKDNKERVADTPACESTDFGPGESAREHEGATDPLELRRQVHKAYREALASEGKDRPANQGDQTILGQES